MVRESKKPKNKTNQLAIEQIGWIIEQMHAEAAKRNAPVFRAEASKNTPFPILVFTMLSARTKDSTTLTAVDRLFEVANSADQIAKIEQTTLEKLLYGVGFYRVKSKNLIEICRRIVVRGGEVPDTLEELLSLPGIGRKTANIILSRAFGKVALGVDVHVHRISNRLGIVKTKKPEETEQVLMKQITSNFIRTLNRDFVAFGQTICLPKKPICSICPINKICWRVDVK
ncbi:endonuclease III [Candidatus Micrarchaeota archaeon]|nr:endonuclease III [Candidatus Micrarchaeota archaeon]